MDGTHEESLVSTSRMWESGSDVETAVTGRVDVSVSPVPDEKRNVRGVLKDQQCKD